MLNNLLKKTSQQIPGWSLENPIIKKIIGFIYIEPFAETVNSKKAVYNLPFITRAITKSHQAATATFFFGIIPHRVPYSVVRFYQPIAEGSQNLGSQRFIRTDNGSASHNGSSVAAFNFGILFEFARVGYS